MDRSVVEDNYNTLSSIGPIVPLSAIHTPKDYDKAALMLNQLLDAGAASANSIRSSGGWYARRCTGDIARQA